MGCAASVKSQTKLQNIVFASPRPKHLERNLLLLSKENSPTDSLNLDIIKGRGNPSELQELNKLMLSTKVTLPDKSDFKNDRREEDLKFDVENVLYYLDEINIKLFYLQVSTNKWRCNDLSKAELVTPMLGKTKISKIFTNLLHLQTSAFVSIKAMRFIGANHFDYDTEENCFYKRSQMNNPTTRPLLGFSTNKIYAISGKINENELSNNFEEYDLQTGNWINLEDIPGPHFGGSCLVSKTSNSIFVIGGFQACVPASYNPFLSIFDTDLKKWSRIPLEEMAIRVPKLMMNTQIVEYEDGKLLLFGTENQYKYYEIDLKSKKLASKGNLPIESEGAKFQITLHSVSNDLILSIILDPLILNIEKEVFGLVFSSKKPYIKWSHYSGFD